MSSERTRPFDPKLRGKIAYSPILGDEDGSGLGLADYGVPGYSPCPGLGTFKTYAQADAQATAMNRAMGLDDRTAFRIVASTMG